MRFPHRPAGTGHRRTPPRMVVVAVAIAMLAACSGGQAARPGLAATPASVPAFESVAISPAVLTAGDPVPLPASTVLTVRGLISVTNDGDSLQLGTDTLDQLGVLGVGMYEPWVKKHMSFQGVWLADLLRIAGVEESATHVRLVALDDYEVDLSLADVQVGGIFLATKTESGAPLPIEEGGPTRIVFMDHVKAGENAGQWIWSLKELELS
ncbi:MAG: molybdopterin-dependent oxidoreductase [Cellulomonas sp.]